MRTTISTKGQLVLPAELRRRDGVVPGEEFEIRRLGRGVYRLARTTAPLNEGLVDHLLACPEKGWFVPVPSDSTADLAGPGIEEPDDQIPR
ncbi:AbrB/MazE/SpoVT family DNA-binding domain-containing protein [Candidatus Palauibacter sp.]|uniref:AbrB/MazE/SpoVT family DNA-binding domain-containing protein n=1 Tax=Candidatus Palauibacter sp. TaxID=3101350 RepID=UPI003B01807E